jgi:hypothetical protein
MALQVRITNPHVEGSVVLGPDAQPFTFGAYAEGVGCIKGPTVSRSHGVITLTDEGFAVSAIGSRLGVVVFDLATPSMITVPMGVGPVAMPFGQARLTIDQRELDRCLVIEVSGSEACERWNAAWTAEIRTRWTQRRAASTEPPWRHMKWSFQHGGVMAWFRTLVAMCVPELEGRSGYVPTNKELAERLFLSVGVIERHVSDIHLQLDVPTGPGSREELVRLAVRQGFVTRDDVAAVLNP